MSEQKVNYVWTLTFGAWLVAAVATLDSLFFSEIMKYPPSVLCWYQRICMCPLVAIFWVEEFGPEQLRELIKSEIDKQKQRTASE